MFAALNLLCMVLLLSVDCLVDRPVILLVFWTSHGRLCCQKNDCWSVGWFEPQTVHYFGPIASHLFVGAMIYNNILIIFYDLLAHHHRRGAATRLSYFIRGCEHSPNCRQKYTIWLHNHSFYYSFIISQSNL